MSELESGLAAVQARLQTIVQGRSGACDGRLNRQALRLTAAATADLQQGLERWKATGGVQELWGGSSSFGTGDDESEWLGWLSIVAEMLEGENAELAQLSRLGAEVEREILGLNAELDAETDPNLETAAVQKPGLQSPKLESRELERPASEGESGEKSPAVVLLGMGGSSLGPEVLSGVLACRWPLFVLDTTDPSQIARVEQQIDLKRSLFVVSSKSGSTLETAMLFDYFFERLREVGIADRGNRFVAVTDEGSELEHLARQRSLRAVFYGKKNIGGRYSVLSNFGLVPSALVGIDTTLLLESALPMLGACARRTDNPGLELGLVLGQASLAGRDKVTFIASESLRGFGAWAEQLLAESTGKEGKGIVPVDLEAPMGVQRYGSDRLFVSLEMRDPDRLEEISEGGNTAKAGETSVLQGTCVVQETSVSKGTSGERERREERENLRQRLRDLEQAGHPVVRIVLDNEYSIAQEFFRWMFATAVAGAVLEINPFDQPDVEASKLESRRLTDAFERSGSLPSEVPAVEGTRTVFFVDPWNREELGLHHPDEDRGLVQVLQSHLGRIVPGDYFAILAYMDRSEEGLEILQAMRGKVSHQLAVATCLGFGPRFLHSTGQAYKGGANTGVFLQITHDERNDLAAPGRSFTFGVAKAAQARGDFEVMAERHRRLLRVHFRGRLIASLQRLDGLIGRSLQALRDGDAPQE